MAKYDAVIFDFDGTVAYTAADVWDSLRWAARRLGGELDGEFSKNDANLGLPMERIFAAAQPCGGDVRAFDELVRQHYRTLSEYPKTALYEGMRPLLERLGREGIGRYVISQKPLEPLTRILRRKGWSGLFEGWFSPDSFGETAATKAQTIGWLLGHALRGKSAVYAGDTWSDVEAAHASGIPCIAALYGDGDTARLLAAGPDLCARTAAEIGDCLFEKENIC
ncbi:MAG: HAD family hydrolase [Oscillospiraceae bacterium]|nr:HAD family hydrolase [Oscillospiraceae bacterium]